jgi:sec-independent protein translocase protein TatB
VPFDLSMWKLLVLGIIAVVIFGPDRLPEIARDAGRMLRQLRGMAQAARTELKAELGDTVGDFDLADLNPRAFVRKHLLDGLDGDLTATEASKPSLTKTAAAAPAAAVSQPAPYDADAT